MEGWTYSTFFFQGLYFLLVLIANKWEIRLYKSLYMLYNNY